MLSLFIIIPLLVLMLLNLPFRSLMLRCAFYVGALLSLAQTVVMGLAILGFWDIRALAAIPFFTFALGIDKLGVLLLLCNGLIVFISFLVAKSFIEAGRDVFNFTSLLLIALCGINGIALTRDIFSLYVFLEITSISSFILISFQKKSDALEGAFKYIILSSIATVFMLSAIALFLLIAGDTSFEGIRRALAGNTHLFLVMLAIGLFLCGLFIKGGLVPFHGWLPDAYTAAPAPVSIFLAGIATKALGIYTLLRLIVSVLGPGVPVHAVLLPLGILSVFIGALAALTQSDFKRMLAYSSISQIGYIVLGFACGTPLGFAGAALHFFNHAVFKSLLFVNSAALEKSTGRRVMEQLGGVAERMPITGISSVVASLSCAGVPPLAGFWSKLLIIVALWKTAHTHYAIAALLASILTLAYMLYMQRKIFFGRLNESLRSVQEAGFGITCAQALLTFIIIGVGIAFPLSLCRLLMP